MENWSGLKIYSLFWWHGTTHLSGFGRSGALFFTPVIMSGYIPVPNWWKLFKTKKNPLLPHAGMEMLIPQFVILSTPDLAESTWWPCWPPLAVDCGQQAVYLCVHKDLLQNAVVLAKAKMDSKRGFCLKYCSITESLVAFSHVSFMSLCPKKVQDGCGFFLCWKTQK